MEESFLLPESVANSERIGIEHSARTANVVEPHHSPGTQLSEDTSHDISFALPIALDTPTGESGDEFSQVETPAAQS